MRFQVSICSDFMLLRDFMLLMTYICDLFCQVCIPHQHGFRSNFHSLPILSSPHVCSQDAQSLPSFFSCSGIENSFFNLTTFFVSSLAVLRWIMVFIYYYYYCLNTWRGMPHSCKILDKILLPLKSLGVSALTSVWLGFPHHLCHRLHNVGFQFSKNNLICFLVLS